MRYSCSKDESKIDLIIKKLWNLIWLQLYDVIGRLFAFVFSQTVKHVCVDLNHFIDIRFNVNKPTWIYRVNDKYQEKIYRLHN